MARNEIYEGVQSLEGKKIATSYKRILSDYLTQNGVHAEVYEISGSVEITPSLGLADAVFDIVGTGSTLLANGLREVATVMESEALLVATPNLAPEKQELLDRLLFRIHAFRNAQQHRYILLNAPDDHLQEIIDLLPGMKSPTILPLAVKGWTSVHSVVPEHQFWDILEKLKAAGAQGILVVPIERMIL
jgi:ATP phosphoribosyltransferase